MAQYRYARDSLGMVVDAQDLAQRNDDQLPSFVCLACEQRLVAKVRGMQRQPHFAHYPGTTCSSPETYLHRLGKLVFAEVFTNCLATGTPFEIELSHAVVCHRFDGYLVSPCILETVQRKTYDLTNWFNEVRFENRDGSFIPDLLLLNNQRPQLRMYVEIAVTHFLSEKKERSTKWIIEIPLESEADLGKIRSCKLTEETARFVNFATESELATDSMCKCAQRPTFAFIVYDSGKSVLDKGTMEVLVAKQARLRGKIRYFRLMEPPRLSSFDSAFLPSPSVVFREAVIAARKEGFHFNNCYLCRFQGDNFNGDAGSPIYCKRFKKVCNSNEAVGCKGFWLRDEIKRVVDANARTQPNER